MLQIPFFVMLNPVLNLLQYCFNILKIELIDPETSSGRQFFNTSVKEGGLKRQS
jgi:hypothetical protein